MSLNWEEWEGRVQDSSSLDQLLVVLSKVTQSWGKTSPKSLLKPERGQISLPLSLLPLLFPLPPCDGGKDGARAQRGWEDGGVWAEPCEELGPKGALCQRSWWWCGVVVWAHGVVWWLWGSCPPGNPHPAQGACLEAPLVLLHFTGFAFPSSASSRCHESSLALA